MMSNTFKTISDSERVWIFASPSIISDEISLGLQNDIKSFLSKWQAHGKDLKSNVEIIDKHFIIISVDENFAQATGCSIDTMMHFIVGLEKNYSLSLTDRSKVFFKSNDEIINANFTEIKSLIEKGSINESTLVYNNSISTGIDLKNNWMKQASISWISKFFQKSFV